MSEWNTETPLDKVTVADRQTEEATYKELFIYYVILFWPLLDPPPLNRTASPLPATSMMR